MHNREEVAARLRQERERLGLNQADFGAIAGVSRRTQAAYEGGTTSPDIEYLAAIADVGVDVGFILSGNAGTAISPEESELLRQFRAASPEVRAAIFGALGAVLVDAAPVARTNIAGDVGQVIAGDAYHQKNTIKVGEKRGRGK